MLNLNQTAINHEVLNVPGPSAADPADVVVLIDQVNEWTGTPSEAAAVQEGLQEAVCTDHAGKMTGIASISTSPSENPYCAMRAKNPDLICHECYAAALEAMRKGLAEKLRRATTLLTAAAYPVDLQPVFPAGPARIEAFGDVARINQAVNYIRIARRNPWTTFAAWTKNPWIWDRAFQYDGGKPSNLIMIVSSPRKGDRLPESVVDRFPWIDHIFTVWESVAAATAAGVRITCGGRSCKKCRRCYSLDQHDLFVDEVLKVHGTAPEGWHHDVDGYHGYTPDVAGLHVVHNTTGVNRSKKWVRYYDGDSARRMEYFRTAAEALVAPSVWH